MIIQKKDMITLRVIDFLGISLLVSLGLGILILLVAPEQLSSFSNVIITIIIIIGTVSSGTKIFRKFINSNV